MITPEQLIDQAANLYGLSAKQIRTRTRVRHIVRARQVAMYLISKKTDMSLHEIGRLFGDYDHTTVMYAVGIVERLLKESPGLANEIAALLDSRIFLERSDPNVSAFLKDCGL
jgi:chromosomal replication initiator protein